MSTAQPVKPLTTGRPFAKGHDPRRVTKGRPLGSPSIPDMLRRIGRERLPPELQGKLPEHIKGSRNMLTALLRCVYMYALKGDAWAVTFIAERTEDKIKDVLEMHGGQRLEIVEEIVDGEASTVSASATSAPDAHA